MPAVVRAFAADWLWRCSLLCGIVGGIRGGVVNATLVDLRGSTPFVKKRTRDVLMITPATCFYHFWRPHPCELPGWSDVLRVSPAQVAAFHGDGGRVTYFLFFLGGDLCRNLLCFKCRPFPRCCVFYIPACDSSCELATTVRLLPSA